MSANEIHQNDIGTAFTITVMDDTTIVPIQSATTRQFKFKKPSGIVVTKNNVPFVTDGSDGRLRYTTIADDLDEAGKWYIQVYLVITGWTGHSDQGDFVVYSNL